MGVKRTFCFVEQGNRYPTETSYAGNDGEQRKSNALGAELTLEDRNGLVDAWVLGAAVRIQTAFERACERGAYAVGRKMSPAVQGLRILGIG